MSVYAWLLITAVLFTAFGFFWGRSSVIATVINSTINSLIEDGYLKTRGCGEDEELVRWREWNSK
jgi:hypothetical protein